VKTSTSKEVNLYILQDEKARRDRDRTKWNGLMDEIARLKTKVLQH